MKTIDAREAICVFWLHEGFISSQEEWDEVKKRVNSWTEEQIEEYIKYISEEYGGEI